MMFIMPSTKYYLTVLILLHQPLWRVWNAAGTGGRGVVGVLEANFIEPSHNKQGFECTKMMAKLVTRLAEIQKDYWFVSPHYYTKIIS